MSYKVYEAYRLKKGVKLFDWFSRVHPLATRAWQKSFLNFVRVLASNIRPGDPRLSARPSTDPLRWGDRCEAASNTLCQKFRQQAGSMENNMFDLSAHLNIYHHKGRYLLIPYGTMFLNKFWDFLKEDPDVEPYEWWDNVDPNPQVPPKDWKARGEVWREVLDSDSPTVIFEVASPLNYRNPMVRMHIPGMPENCSELRGVLAKPEPWPTENGVG